MAKGLGKGLSALFGDSNYDDNFNEKQVTNPEEETKKDAENKTEGKTNLDNFNEIKIAGIGEVEKVKSLDDLEDLNVNKIEVDSIDSFESNKENKDSIVEIKLTEIEPNSLQARKHFDENKLIELSESIKTFGVLQPIIVTKKDGYYEIIAGERRWRAAKIAGLTTIPTIVKKDKVADNANISIIENIQRENLNAIEKAKGYKELIDTFNYDVDDLSTMLSKTVYSIRDSLDLLNLDPRVIKMVEKSDIPQSVCKTLLKIDDADMQYEVALYIIEDGLTVEEAKSRLKLSQKKKDKTAVPFDPIFKEVEDKFTNYFGARARLKVNPRNVNSGQIILKYTSNKELERMLEVLDENTF